MDLSQFDDLLHDAEVKLKRLKALYEQWFQGIERIEPLIARKDLDRTLSILNKEKPRNTAARFRLQQLVARYAIYATYWQRIARQIEEGTFVRDVRRVHEMHMSARKKVKTYEIEQDVDLTDEDLGSDEIAGILTELETVKKEAPKPATAFKPAFSVFSPFAKKVEPAKPPSTAPAKPPSTAPAPSTAKKPDAQPAPQVQKPAPPAPALMVKRPAAPLELSLELDLPPAPKPAAAVPKPAAAVPKPAAPTPPAPPPTPTPPPAKKPIAATFGKPKPPATPPPKDELRNLYEKFVDARRKNNEPVDNVAYDKIASSVEKIRSNLQQKHGDKKIDFEVVVQDGKVALKPKIR